MKSLLTSPLTIFIAQALVIILTGRVIGLFTRRLQQPMVIAETLAGILLGPSLLGWALPGVSKLLFPAESLGLVSVFAQIGLVLFMFLVGMEVDPRMLRGRARASLVISHVSIVVPFALGCLLSFYLHPRLTLSPKPPFTVFALFMGAAMSITAFPVLARILAERGMLSTRIGSLAITCAAIDDMTAWCILAFVVALTRATGLLAAASTTLLAALYAAFVLFVVRPVLQRLSERTPKGDGISQNLVAIALALLLLSSWVTEVIGVHALFGAFLMGIAIPRERGFATSLCEKLESIVVVFLLPLFFAYSGLRTQIGLLDGVEPMVRFGLVLATACVGKFGGATLAARATGLPWRDASAIGVLMNTRGLMELVVLNIGLDLGVISPRLFTIMVFMALVTTFMASPLLAKIYPTARQVEELELQQRPMEASVPAFNVVAYAHGARIQALSLLAAAIAGGGARANEVRRVFPLRLLAAGDADGEAEGAVAEDADVERVTNSATKLGVALRPLSFVSSEPARDICRVAQQKAADLLLIDWEQPSQGQADLPNTVGRLLREAHCDVGVLVDRGLDVIRRVAVLDPSPEGLTGSGERRIQRTDAKAIELARRVGGGSGSSVEVIPESRLASVGDHDLIVIGLAGHRAQMKDAHTGILESCRASLLYVQAPEDRERVKKHTATGAASAPS